MNRTSLPGRQRGVALLIALVLMALATILAVKIGFGGIVERKRTTTMLAAEQAFQFALGAEALAADVLTRQSQGAQQVTLADAWAQAPQPIPLRPPNDPEGEPMGTLEGYLQDESGRFNINTLLHLTPDGKPDPVPLAQFEALLTLLSLEPKWATLARDWIDADTQESFPDGAEDSVYTSQDPPYLTSNWPMMSTTELMSLPGFGAERYQKLAPYITALPTTKPQINVCTAPGYVLDMLTGSSEFGGNPETMIKFRKTRCFPTIDELTANMPADQKAKTRLLVSEKSDYFRLTTRVTLGSTEFTLYSLLLRGGGGASRVTPILRSFGTT
jgi:general secretion pathway protein K